MSEVSKKISEMKDNLKNIIQEFIEFGFHTPKTIYRQGSNTTLNLTKAEVFSIFGEYTGKTKGDKAVSLINIPELNAVVIFKNGK